MASGLGKYIPVTWIPRSIEFYMPDSQNTWHRPLKARKWPQYIETVPCTFQLDTVFLTTRKPAWLAGTCTMYESMYFLLKTGDFPIETGSFPIETGDLPFDPTVPSYAGALGLALVALYSSIHLLSRSLSKMKMFVLRMTYVDWFVSVERFL